MGGWVDSRREGGRGLIKVKKKDAPPGTAPQDGSERGAAGR